MCSGTTQRSKYYNAYIVIVQLLNYSLSLKARELMYGCVCVLVSFLFLFPLTFWLLQVEYYPQHERLRQPIAAVCKRCFLPNRPMMNWSGAGIRGSLSKFYVDPIVETARSSAANAARIRSISTNSLPSGPSKSRIYPFHSWGTPPRITALQRGVYRRNGESMDNYEY